MLQSFVLLAFEPNFSVTAHTGGNLPKTSPAGTPHSNADRHDFALSLVTQIKCAFLAEEKDKRKRKKKKEEK